MIMVIFGAGASFDAVPSRPPWAYPREMLDSRLPLATELFLDLELFTGWVANFPQCKPIIPYLRSIPPGVTLEHVLENLQEEGKTDPERLRQIAAIRYYLQCVIWECENRWNSVAHGITNYVTLLDQLRRSRTTSDPVLLVTFNYDRMIESTLSSVDISIRELPDYIRHDSFKLFKLHGSVHWAREIENPVANINEMNNWNVANNLISIAPDINITDRFRIVDHHPTGKVGDIPLFPAIAIPVETKINFECPSSHLDCLRAFLGKVTKVLTVGWAAQEQHFLKLLREHLTEEIHVKVVAGNIPDGEQALDRVRGAGIRLIAEPPAAGFTEYAVSREAELFLKA
ncbi:MAG: hypothetical protein ABSD90_01350 [Methylocystis sp.]|jgi:hypothetical protein